MATAFFATVFLAVTVFAAVFLAGAEADFFAAALVAVFLAGGLPTRPEPEAEACFEPFLTAGDFLVAAAFFATGGILFLSGIPTLILLIVWSLSPISTFRTETNSSFRRKRP